MILSIWRWKLSPGQLLIQHSLPCLLPDGLYFSKYSRQNLFPSTTSVGDSYLRVAVAQNITVIQLETYFPGNQALRCVWDKISNWQLEGKWTTKLQSAKRMDVIENSWHHLAASKIQTWQWLTWAMRTYSSLGIYSAVLDQLYRNLISCAFSFPFSTCTPKV